MTEKNEKNNPGHFILTDDIITNLDVGRILRELEKLDDNLHQAKLREENDTQSPPKTTEMLNGLAEANKLSLSNSSERKQLIDELKELKTKGKKIHISFAIEPSPQVIRKITLWLRENIQKNLMLEVGIQPTISVGCVVRTTNKVFDLSLRNRFRNSKDMLSGSLEKQP